MSDADRCSGVGFLFMHFLINTSRLIIPHPIKCCITAQKHSRQQPVTLQQDLQDLTVDFNVALFTTITLQCSGNFYCSVESCTVEATLTVTPLSFFFFLFSSRPLFQELWAITAPRPGTNSSSEASTSGKGSGRLSPKTSAACLGGWDEGGTARGNARKYGESIQTAIKRRLQNPNLGPSCNEVTAPPTLFHIYCLFTPVIKATFAVNYEFHYCIETCLVFFFYILLF